MLTIDPRAGEHPPLQIWFYFVLNIPRRRAVCQGIKSLHILLPGGSCFAQNILKKQPNSVSLIKKRGENCAYT